MQVHLCERLSTICEQDRYASHIIFSGPQNVRLLRHVSYHSSKNRYLRFRSRIRISSSTQKQGVTCFFDATARH